MNYQIIKDYITNMVDRDQAEKRLNLMELRDSSVRSYTEEIVNCSHSHTINSECQDCNLFKKLIKHVEEEYEKKNNRLLEFKAAIMQYLDHEQVAETTYNENISSYWKAIDEKHKEEGIILVNDW